MSKNRGVKDMWKNCVENAYKDISLHDCVVNCVEIFDNILSLTLDDGFWMLADSKFNSCGETVRTDKSKIIFDDFDENLSVFYVFKRHYFLGKRICTTRKRVKMQKLFEKINSGEWEIEFSDQYYAFHRVLFFGSVTTKKKIWEFDFQLVIDCEKMEYCWNNICTDRKW